MNAPTIVSGAVATTAAAVAIAAQEAAAAATISRSTAEIIQIIGAVSAAAVVVGGVIVQIITARMKVAVANAVAPVALAVAAVDGKAEAIKHSVDGTATEMKSMLKSAREEIERLREDKVDQKEIIIAQAGAAAPVAPKPLDAPVAALVDDMHGVQQKIETNTRETAKAVKHLEKGAEDTDPNG